MKTTDIAYAAGAIDADGCISIKRTTQRMRLKRDCRNPVYSPRISLGQVTPQVPEFLKEHFSGAIYKTKPGTRNSRPLFKWYISDKTAFIVAGTLLPFLKIKHLQALALIRLHSLKETGGALSIWYPKLHPNWRHEELITSIECAEILGYKHSDSVHQAIEQGTILNAHPGRHGRTMIPKIPRQFVHELATLAGRNGNKFIACPQFVAAQHDLWSQVAELNKVGINGSPANNRTGCYVPAW